jgi:hypothetical protein
MAVASVGTSLTAPPSARSWTLLAAPLSNRPASSRAVAASSSVISADRVTPPASPVCGARLRCTTASWLVSVARAPCSGATSENGSSRRWATSASSVAATTVAIAAVGPPAPPNG